MQLRPDRNDVTLIGFYLGRILTSVGLLMLPPALLGVVLGEFNEALGFTIAASITIIVGRSAEWKLRSPQTLDWSQGLVIAALAWLVAPFFAAVALYLSGHFGRFLDAYFDAMSGFSGAGLTVISDLDHLAQSVQLFRHSSQLFGSLGLVLLLLSFFSSGGGVLGMYVGEAREEQIMPNIGNTARLIVRVTLFYGAVGVPLIWLGLLAGDYPAATGALHALYLWLAAFGTGGFAPHMASVGFYHSPLVEFAMMFAMLAGATSFGVHYALWRRRMRLTVRNIEVKTFLLGIVVALVVAVTGLVRAGAFQVPQDLWRSAFFQVISAATTTGHATVPPRSFVTSWGPLAPMALVLAMALGTMSGSTGGGIKAVRTGLVVKSAHRDLRRVLLPADAVVIETYHTNRRRVLEDSVVRSASLILLLYLVLYLGGAAFGMFYGYPFDQAMFESTSAAATVGLSVGITGPDLEPGLKVVYILEMWLGRLEFISVFALFGFIWSMITGRT